MYEYVANQDKISNKTKQKICLTPKFRKVSELKIYFVSKHI